MCAFASKNGNNNNSILWILLLLLLLPHSTPVRYTKIFFSMPFYYTRYFSTLSSASVSMLSQCALFHRKRIMCKGARRESTTNGTNHQITKKNSIQAKGITWSHKVKSILSIATFSSSSFSSFLRVFFLCWFCLFFHIHFVKWSFEVACMMLLLLLFSVSF